MDILADYQLPLWVIPISIAFYVVMLWFAHRRMSLAYKFSMVIPYISLTAIYFVFSIFEVPSDIQRFFGRYALAWVFIWHGIILILTRKYHV